MKAALHGAALCVLSLISAGASAQGWFTGGAVGTSTHQDYDIGAPVASSNDSDTAFRVFGGYLISPLQGLVASYVNLGTTNYAGSAFGGFTDTLSARGVDMSYIIGWAPGQQQRISVFGTVGVFAFKQDVRYTDSTGFFKSTDDGTTFSVGVGTDINLSSSGTSAWGIHVEYQLIKDLGSENNSGHEDDWDSLSVGVSYRFGRD